MNQHTVKHSPYFGAEQDQCDSTYDCWGDAQCQSIPYTDEAGQTQQSRGQTVRHANERAKKKKKKKKKSSRPAQRPASYIQGVL